MLARPSPAAAPRFQRARARLAKELPAADRIPYTAHVSDSVIRTREGHFVFVLQLGGASFETADDVQVNQWHEQLNGLLRNIASPQLAIWTHVVRRRDPSRLPGAAPDGFARQLDDAYGCRLAAQALMTNDLFISVVHRPQPRATAAWAQRLFFRTDTTLVLQAQVDALDACAKLQQHLLAALARYAPRLLGIDRSGSVARSEPLAFFGLLVNGEPQPMPLPRAPIAEVLATSRPSFGVEALEYRAPTATRIGAMLGIKEYPTPSVPDMYHRLLTAPFSFVLTQSFTFLAKPTAQGLLQAQYNRMVNAGDLARSQAEALQDALDALTGNEFVLGDHHFTLQVMTEAHPGVGDRDAGPRLAQLNDCVAAAREMLADTGMVVAREDLALEAAFWAQLPGNFAYRPRKSPITSRNFAAMSPFDNFPRGSANANHWGPALALLTTRAHSPYFFSLHAPALPLSDGDAATHASTDVGHTFVCGPTGSGKTVFLGFCIAMLGKLGASQVVFDKDRGLEILVRALGGTYAPLASGEPTGFNPLRLEPTAANLMFLREWLAVLVAVPGQPLTVRQQQDLEQALRGVMALEPDARRLSRLVEHLDATDPEGVYPRLARWCEATGGEFAWAFDNPDDQVLPQLRRTSLAAFDVTEFLEHPVIRTPITMYLFHLVRLLLDGRRFVCWCDEFWRLLDDPAFEAFSRDGPKTWRKLNGVFGASTQSASDVIASPISRTLIEQTATKVFLPNPEARPEDYIEGFGLTEREFALIRHELAPGSRQFLIKQGHSSVVCALDLAGMDAELAVISGRRSSVERMHRLIAQLGAEPAQWLPDFIGAASIGAEPTSSTSGELR